MATLKKPTGTRSKVGTAAPAASTPTVAPKRTTRAAAAAKATSTEPVAATSTRKQLKPKPNAAEPTQPIPTSRPVSNRSAGDAVEVIPQPKAARQSSILSTVTDSAADRESLKAYLRIRPNAAADDEDGAPYLTALSDTIAEMSDRSPGFRIRPAQQQGPATYTFSRVFKPEVSQRDFFTNTTLPLVRSLLDGESGLLFAYGVTNSGKTYTIQGGTGDGEAGVLPRALDVMFNSIEGLQSKAPLRPARLNDVEYDSALIDSASSQLSVESAQPFDFASLKADQGTLDGLLEDDIDSFDIDDTVYKVDRNYEYAVWISYAEVYNEKIYDLLGDSSPARATTSASSSVFSFATTSNLTALASTDANHPMLLKRRALALKNDPDSQGKYISGLREVRVRTREEARAIVKLGQLNRRVFGTLANAASSRSHSVFTIRLIRVHGGSPTADEAHCARLAIVDLAGSERMKNTGAAGERLREAGAINKSLMVLGQCMEIMRANQRRLALAAGSSVPPKLAMVPFRHSKLTEIFIDFFTGGGRAAMIVNVNPYDTGFDENSHVMKFAALAKEVSTGTVRRPTLKTGDRASTVRRITVSMGGKRPTEAHLEIVEEDAEDTVVEDDEPVDGLVEALFEQVQELRMKLFEAELRSADIESDIREEVADEMRDRFLSVQRKFTQRMLDMEEENDLRTEAKLDMLRDAGVFKPTQPCQTCAARRRADKVKAAAKPLQTVDNETEEEDEVGSILGHSDNETERFDLDNVDGGSETEELPEEEDDSDAEDPPSSPLAGRSSSVVRLAVESRIEGSIGLLGSDAEDESDAEETASYLESESEDEDEDEEDMLDSDEEESRDGDLTREDQYDPSVVADSRRTTMASDYSDFTHQSELSLHSLELSPIPVTKHGRNASLRVSDASESSQPSPPPTVKKPVKKKDIRVSYTTTDVSEMSPPPTVKKAAGKKNLKMARPSETSVDELDFLSPQRPRRSARPTKAR